MNHMGAHERRLKREQQIGVSWVRIYVLLDEKRQKNMRLYG